MTSLEREYCMFSDTIHILYRIEAALWTFNYCLKLAFSPFSILKKRIFLLIKPLRETLNREQTIVEYSLSELSHENMKPDLSCKLKSG